MTVNNIWGHEEEGPPFHIWWSSVFVRLHCRDFGFVHKQKRPFPQRSVASHILYRSTEAQSCVIHSPTSKHYTAAPENAIFNHTQPIFPPARHGRKVSHIITQDSTLICGRNPPLHTMLCRSIMSQSISRKFSVLNSSVLAVRERLLTADWLWK